MLPVSSSTNMVYFCPEERPPVCLWDLWVSLFSITVVEPPVLLNESCPLNICPFCERWTKPPTPCAFAEKSRCNQRKELVWPLDCVCQCVLPHNVLPLWMCSVVPWLHMIVVRISESRSSLSSPLVHCSFSLPKQINVLHLIKDASCRLSGICLLSPAISLSPIPFCLCFPFFLMFPSSCQSLLHPITCTES